MNDSELDASSLCDEKGSNGTDFSSTASTGESSESAPDSAPEVWDGNDSDSASETESSANSTFSHFHFMVSAFVSFFQLCFRVPDRAIALLLGFMLALLRALLVLSNDGGILKQFTDGFPRTLYSVKKLLNFSKSCEEYVVCPRCHTLYKKSDCIIKLSGGDRGLKCDFVRYPNHPQSSHRKKCGKELMKKVKVRQTYKLVPRKTYVYYGIVQPLKKLVKTPGFLDNCETWRNRKTPDNWLADVYDGNLWKEWMKPGGVSYLEVPGNLVLMLNIDWFQPFAHIQYSVGVIYLVIQNLPRSLRFKPENIIIVSTIPGPKEPSCGDLNPYLSCMVDELLTLWEGVQMETPCRIFPTKM